MVLNNRLAIRTIVLLDQELYFSPWIMCMLHYLFIYHHFAVFICYLLGNSVVGLHPPQYVGEMGSCMTNKCQNWTLSACTYFRGTREVDRGRGDSYSWLSITDIVFIMSSPTSAWLLSPLECSPHKQNGWTPRLCFWGWILWKMYNKTIIEFGFRMISWIIKTSCLCYLPKPKTQTSVLIIHDIMLNLIQ